MNRLQIGRHQRPQELMRNGGTFTTCMAAALLSLSVKSFALQQLQRPATRLARSLQSPKRIVTHSALSFHHRHYMTSSTTRSSLASPLPALVDVDCNLWHADLRSLQGLGDEAKGTDNKLLYILQEDAVVEHNIRAMLSPSSTIREAQKGIALLQQYQGPICIKTTVGVHPYHVNDEELREKTLENHVDDMRELLVGHKSLCMGVGECGLDASEGFPPMADQIPWFQAQIDLAQDLQLPLFVHERLGFDTCMQMLQDATVPIIIHCFTGTVDECRAYIDRGYSISLSGYLFKPEAASQACECLRQGVIPLDRLMMETDAPYMGFAGCRDNFVAKHADYVESLNSKRRKRLITSTYPNLPSALPMVLDKVLDELNAGRSSRGEELLSRQEVAEATTRNAQVFFGFELS